MYEQTNSFGRGYLHLPNDIKGPSHLVCMACPAIYADTQAWATGNKDIVAWSDPADNTIVMGCPATNKTITETIRYTNRCTNQVYLAGCIAQRFDISVLPHIKRLSHVYCDYKTIAENNASYYMIGGFPCAYGATKTSRYDHYPFSMCHMIRLGWGRANSICNRLGEVRPMPRFGSSVKEVITSLYNDYMSHKNKTWLMIVSDGINYQQMLWWLKLIIEHPPVMGVSFYNVQLEALRGKVEELLCIAALKKHIKKLHIPLYGLSAATLKIFSRSVSKTHTALPLLEKIRSYGTDIYTDAFSEKELFKYVDFVSTIGEIEMPKQKLSNYMEL